MHHAEGIQNEKRRGRELCSNRTTAEKNLRGNREPRPRKPKSNWGSLARIIRVGAKLGSGNSFFFFFCKGQATHGLFRKALRAAIGGVAESRKERCRVAPAPIRRLHLHDRLVIGKQYTHGIVVGLPGRRATAVTRRSPIPRKRDLLHHFPVDVTVVVTSPVALVDPICQRKFRGVVCHTEEEILRLKKHKKNQTLLCFAFLKRVRGKKPPGRCGIGSARGRWCKGWQEKIEPSRLGYLGQSQRWQEKIEP